MVKFNTIKEDEYQKRKAIGVISQEDYQRVLDNPRPITKEKVIEGIKYIINNRYANQQELTNGLIEIGCTFTVNDVINQLTGGDNLLEGINKGSLSCGALVIINMRDGEAGRIFCDDVLLSYDSPHSLYHYIRILTNDENYTKDNIDAEKRHK